MKIVNFKEIPIALIKKIIMREKLSEGEAGDLQKRVLEYSEYISKCSPNASENVYRALIDLGFREITSVQIINICPRSFDELKTLLYFEKEVPEKDILEKVLKILKDQCGC